MMPFQNKWANLFLIALISAVVTVLLVYHIKVVDQNGCYGGLSLTITPQKSATTLQVYQ